MTNLKVTVVVGNPNPRSRTLDAAVRLAERFGASSPTVINLVDLGADLLGRGEESVEAAKASVVSADLAIFASPTFKATYSGLLKLFVDQFESGEHIGNVVAVPLMVGGHAAHAAGVELHLKPLLVELGLICPTPGIFQLDTTYTDDPALDAWVERWRPVVASLTERKLAA